MFDKDPLSALEAITAAQHLAFAPLAFHAASVMRDRGVLAALAKAAPGGLCMIDIALQTALPAYAVRVLLEAGLGMHLVWREAANDRYHLGKLGRFLLDDEMTRVNFDFTRDVCYAAAAHLDESLLEGRPAGLQALGPWPSLYQGLSTIPEPARRSWLAFDHFHSDAAFPDAIARLARNPPRSLLDVGCNTGRWAAMCLQHLPDCQIGLCDLPLQLEVARENLLRDGPVERLSCHATDLLDPAQALPEGFELVWMSQLLDCFSEAQIVAILRKVHAALPAGGRLWILELFWDRQRFEAAAFSLQQTSLYFACVANGNSQFYDSTVFLPLLAQAGFEVTALTDGVGDHHTLLECAAVQIPVRLA
jgi:SAM-dependent methyltransferase